jgi:hypothetical protein
VKRDRHLHLRILALLSILILSTATISHGANGEGGPSRAAGHMEAPLTFGKVIPVELQAGTTAEPGLFTLAWVVFGKSDNDIRATVRGTMQSAPRGKWQVAIRLLDQEGRPVATDLAVIENPELVIGVAITQEGDMHLSFKQASRLLAAKRFRMEVSEATAEARADAKLTPPEWKKAPEGDFSLEVSIRGSKPPAEGHSECILWRSVVETEPKSPVEGLSVLRAGTAARWYDPTTKQTWESCRVMGYIGRKKRLAFKGLPSGTYRVTAVSSSGSDPSPLGASQPVHLSDENRKGELALELKGEYPLLIKVVRASTGQPVPSARVVLRRADGMPLVARSSSYGSQHTDGKGMKRFLDLERGSYAIHAGLHQDLRRWEIRPSSTPVVVPVEIGPGGTTEIVVSLPKTSQ